MRRRRGFGGIAAEHAGGVRTFREQAAKELAIAREKLARGDCFGGAMHLIVAIRSDGIRGREEYYAGMPPGSTRDEGFMLGVSAAMGDYALCSRMGEAGEVRRARQRAERRAEREWLRRHEG